MKNNKGFTIIEFSVSFILVSTISIILLQLVLSFKELYLNGDVKTSLLTKQGIMTKNIYDDLNNKKLSSITSCGLSCITFTYSEGTEKNLLVDPGNNTITYGDYTLKLDSASKFGQLSVNVDESSPMQNNIEDSIISIKIPITSNLLNNETFGFNIVKTYNRSETSINLNSDLETTNVTLSGINTNLTAITYNNKVKSILVKIYRQTKNNYFDNDYNHFIKNNNTDTFSTLVSLPALKMTKDKEIIIDDISNSSLSEKEKKEAMQSYQNGYYSLILNYNDASLSNNNYYWWYQTNNIAHKEPLKGLYLGFPNAVGTGGLTYNNTGNYWANIEGKSANIGIKSGDINDFNGTVANSVDLYADAREYICKYAMTNVTYNGTNIKDLTLYDSSKFCK